ncbi:DUF11 domain-containing protein [Stratiformator vulcanicus]|uniref:Large cysteine-rich periplasmic protein OmcB n=1 Tax=Stratiformator vulcanicus TaxID=2527980 RepID=A0A517R219_9PLAN|nr:DUF11 domain-containing protein [Stratiformator vulcanicus]QDT37926.1 Large cysteine-rich periplasmic protein OmcB precursor [Stratiformator vulcanicus]
MGHWIWRTIAMAGVTSLGLLILAHTQQNLTAAPSAAEAITTVDWNAVGDPDSPGETPSDATAFASIEDEIHPVPDAAQAEPDVELAQNDAPPQESTWGLDFRASPLADAAFETSAAEQPSTPSERNRRFVRNSDFDVTADAPTGSNIEQTQFRAVEDPFDGFEPVAQDPAPVQPVATETSFGFSPEPIPTNEYAPAAESESNWPAFDPVEQAPTPAFDGNPSPAPNQWDNTPPEQPTQGNLHTNFELEYDTKSPPTAAPEPIDDFLIPPGDNASQAAPRQTNLDQPFNSGTKNEFGNEFDRDFDRGFEPRRRDRDPFGEESDSAANSREAVPAFDEREPTDRPRLLPASDFELRGVGTVGENASVTPQQPTLKIEKSAPETAVIGQPYVYEIQVRNTGKADAYQVRVEDLVPRGTTLSGTIPQAEMRGKTLVWDLGTLKSGAEEAIKVRVVPNTSGRIGSVATVSFASEVAARTRIVSPKLSLSVEAPATVNLGEFCEFHFEMENSGEADATGVILGQTLPEGFKHQDGRDLEYEVGTLKAGERRSVRLKVATVGTGQFLSRAALSAQGGLQVEGKAVVTIEDRRLLLTRTGPEARVIGQPGKYVNQVENPGNASLQSVSLVETLPEGLRFLRASDGGTFDPRSRQVIWNLASLAPGQTLETTVWLTPEKIGSFKSNVTVSEVGGREASVQSMTSVAGYAKISPNITGTEIPITVGERCSVEVAIENRGSGAADDVELTVDLSPQLRLLDVRGDLKPAADQFAAVKATSYRLGRPLDPAETKFVTLVVEGVSAGDGRIRCRISDKDGKTPITTDDLIRVFDAAR